MANATESDKSMDKIVFFDGICHLCNSFVDKVIQKDTSHQLRFAPLQGTTAKALLPPHLQENLNSVIFYSDGRFYEKSEAIHEILKILEKDAWFMKVFIFLPRGLQNWGYDLVAKLRYRLFGKSEYCRLPSDSEKKFLLP